MRLRDLMHKSQNPGGPTGLPGLPMVAALQFLERSYNFSQDKAECDAGPVMK
jgi:hypothetical protein